MEQYQNEDGTVRVPDVRSTHGWSNSSQTAKLNLGARRIGFTITLTIIVSRIRVKSAAKGARKIAIDSIRLAIFSPVDTTGLPIPAVMAGILL